ncbi:MAG: SDR family oxidoreductase [Bdellovibrionaceae bacterium]|nr:SDR family oxidoreductase [Pseudobdellovibrionaceae bacterium]
MYWFKRIRPNSYQPVILITGCSSGIGLELAKLFYKLPQYRTVITARANSIAKLREIFLPADHIRIWDLDVTEKGSRSTIANRITDEWGGVDILINNAGISYRSVIEHMTHEDEQLQMATNYLGPMALIRAVLPSMRGKGRGKIINISSVSGMLAMPTMSSYSASKAALEGASEALWYEMRPFGIDVSLIQPGFIHSESFKNVRYTEKARHSENGRDDYSAFYQNMKPFVSKVMGLSRATPESVASLVLHVIQTERPPLWVPASLDAEFFYYLRRLMPRRLLHPLLFKFLPGVKSWGVGFTHKRKRGFWD